MIYHFKSIGLERGFSFSFNRFEICLILDFLVFLKLINNINTHFWSIAFYLFFH